MAVREFKLPDPGEGLTEAEIVTWNVAPGDTVAVNDVVVEIETAKSLVELPVPFAGVVGELLVAVGDTVEVGTPIITVDDGTGGSPAPAAPAAGSADATDAAGSSDGAADAAEANSEGRSEGSMSGRTAVLVGYGVKQTEAKRRPRKQQAPAGTGATDAVPTPAPDGDPAPAPEASAPAPDVTSASSASGGERTRALAKPPVRKLAKDLGVDLGSVTPSGDGGVVTRADVEAAASASHDDAPTHDTAATGPSTPSTPRRDAPTGGETRVPVKGVRRMTAQAMVDSAFTAPHVTEWVDVDVTATMELVERLKADREFADVKVTPLLVVAKAMCLAARRHPDVNASWDEAAQEIVVKHDVNLGIAAATPRGLVVPNVKDAGRMSMLELAQALGALTATAREGRTPPADMAGGTMTITNVGVFGVDAGTPILNPGEAAILAVGSITRKPWVVGTGADERIEPRWVTTLALSFDHRLVDGELGSRFLADVAAVLRDPARGLVWG
ncbi:2-oxo acid dehydrogenase subunit E2 [Phycicoccus sp. BSK3Z-2]|uniref:Dihydrolipoamide acetyltransferase component of pyruvate dehydrogenase complex n=1 Tax=Phycicoccus avicenniae TaxID=2828860 RepID=A0A941I0R7_9MICO|nr:dihydrolipoamide acetyltransferase family protein [Phycicoccus avicenniae]MBR7744200.1 2-oxo acid dehydrogenase subunit E2 [Phycicoccus avicenniae]